MKFSNIKRPCETRLEEISLLAAGCLNNREEHELREHLATCDACRERFNDLASLCSGLRAAKPAVDAGSVRALESSFLHAPSPAQGAGDGRFANWRVAMLALVLLLMVGVLSPLAHRSPVRTDHPERQAFVPDLPQVAAKQSNSPLPNLFALRRAAAESDESLDRLLAQYSGPLVSEPFSFQSVGQELMQ